MSVEFRIAKEVFARRDGTARLCSERLPFRDRPVGRQRFLDPAKAKIGIGALVVLRGDEIPALVDVGHQRALTDHLAHCGKGGKVHFATEADLNLEGVVSLPKFARDDVFEAAGIEAAGIGRNGIAFAAEEPPERRTGFTGREIPKRDVDVGDGLSEGPGFARLQGHNMGFARHCGERGRRRMPSFRQRNWCDVVADQVRAVFRPMHREISEYLAPADCAVAVLCADQEDGPLRDCAE